MEEPNAAEIILELESRRCQALMDGDLSALEGLLANDLVHVHTTGHSESRAEYLETVADRLDFIHVARRELKVRSFPMAVIVTGLLDQELRIRATGQRVTLLASATQIWVETATGWKLASFHACAIAPA